MEYLSFKGKKVLVTGGSGVIGRELLRYLIDEGAEILSVDREDLPDGKWDNVKSLKLDLAEDKLDELIEFNPEIIFHLAAAFERSAESPEFWNVNWHDNIIVSHKVLDAAKEMSALDTFVFASSYLLYNTSLYISDTFKEEATFLNENNHVVPRNLCGGAKYYTESEMEFIKEYYKPNLRTINARIYRVYGRGSRDVISRWVRMCLNNETLELYNKNNRFDYIFAGDVAKGLLTLAKTPDASGVFNLGSGNPRFVKDIIDVLINEGLLTESDIIDNGDTEEYESSCADITRLKETTSWYPPIQIEDGIKLIIEYEK